MGLLGLLASQCGLLGETQLKTLCQNKQAKNMIQAGEMTW